MKISTEFSAAAKIIGPEKSIELTAKAGFEAWDFTVSGITTDCRERHPENAAYPTCVSPSGSTT